METIDATYWRVRLFGKTELDAGSERIGDRGARALAQALAENSTLTSLRLRNQGLGPEGARALAEALRKNSTLAILGLQDNGIGDSGASALAGALLKNSALTKLHLEGNGIGKAGIRKLLGALDTNSSLRELTLDKKDDIPNLPRFIESALQNPDRLRRQEQQKTLPNIGKANLENRTRHETAEDPSTADEHTTVEGESTPKWTAELCPPPRMELLMVPGINPLPLPSSVATANSRWTAGFPSRALSLPEKRSTALLGSPAVNRTIYEIDPLHLRQGNYLGSGAFGIVVDGMYQKHTKVSLKLIKGSDLIGRQLEEAVKELECEMEVWLRLPYHTNVLPLLGWCREPLCLVTLYMTGGTARKYLGALQPSPSKRAPCTASSSQLRWG
ncbi:hypothetical protein DFJ74DRAFT_672827 [Hyaloraphidium curvatum]|nr:hypothetical protein DFJ74DRAFT_672827 [Hyaloraphidium curvatum]